MITLPDLIKILFKLDVSPDRTCPNAFKFLCSQLYHFQSNFTYFSNGKLESVSTES